MAYNKIVYGNDTLIDLTSDTVTADDLKLGVTAHDKSGEVITGTSTLDSDTSQDTVSAAEILDGKTAHARGVLLTGTMPNKGMYEGTISTKEEKAVIPMGFHDGSGSVEIDADEQAKIIPTNIKAGISVLGVVGTYGGEDAKVTSASATPKTEAQTVLPPAGYDYLSQVTVNAIPYTETPNSAGGITVTIAGE